MKITPLKIKVGIHWSAVFLLMWFHTGDARSGWIQWFHAHKARNESDGLQYTSRYNMS